MYAIRSYYDTELLEAENAMYEYIRDSGREPVTGIYRIYENEFFLNKA